MIATIFLAAFALATGESPKACPVPRSVKVTSAHQPIRDVSQVPLRLLLRPMSTLRELLSFRGLPSHITMHR